MKREKKDRDLNYDLRYRRLFETTHIGILLLDSDTRKITDANPFMARLTGYLQSDLIGKKISEVGIFTSDVTGKVIIDALGEKEAEEYSDVTLCTKDGKKTIVELVTSVYHEGERRMIQCIVRDLTERKRAEEAVGLEKLMEQEKLKIDFIADAAHELRTPLAIIKGNVDLGLRIKSNKPKELRDRLEAIDIEVVQLARLLSDLSLLTSKGSTLQRKISSGKVDLSKLLTRTIERHGSFAQEKHITIHTKPFPASSVVGDEHYLERVFVNIIANAILYSKEKGDIYISMVKAAGKVNVIVRDTGIGISQKDLPYIFDRFYRTDSSRSKETGGSGLGLAIVKWIVTAHGGKVGAESVEGKGSTFTITLPLLTS